MAHNFKEGVSFGSLHSYRTWGLILESDSVSFPDVSTSIDNLPIYGIPDFDGKGTYGRRTLTFEFWKKNIGGKWPELIQQITAAIHGRKLEIIRDCEPGHVYIGRCSVEAYEGVERVNAGRIKITVNAEPFTYSSEYITETYEQAGSIELTCSSRLETPAIVTITPRNSLVSVSISGLTGNQSITVNNLSINTPVVIDGYKKTVKQGTENKFHDCDLWQFPSLVPGRNIITITNGGYVNTEIKYREKMI